MFERFTDESRRVLVLAQEEARLLDSGFLGCEHLFLGLIRLEDGIAVQALVSLGVTYDRAREVIERLTEPRESDSSPPFTRGAKTTLQLSLRISQQLGHNYIGPEHLLLGLIQEGENTSLRALKAIGIDPTRVRDAVLESLQISLPPEGLPRPGSGDRDGRFQGPSGSVRYPVRLVPGPSDPIAIQELECHIVGLLIFGEEFEIVWSVAGEHEVLWSLLGVLENDDHPPAGTTPMYIAVTDDVGTKYERESRAFLREPSRWSGHVTCWPPPPENARNLRLTWMDHSIEIAL